MWGRGGPINCLLHSQLVLVGISKDATIFNHKIPSSSMGAFNLKNTGTIKYSWWRDFDCEMVSQGISSGAALSPPVELSLSHFILH